MTPEDEARSIANLKLERDALNLYERLAEIDREPRRSAAFRAIAANERRHADIWAERLRAEGARVPEHDGPRMRVRFILLAARVFGTAAVSDLVRSLEGDEEDAYLAQDSPEVAAIIDDERTHIAIWHRLDAGDLDTAVAAGGSAASATSATGLPLERWHVAGQSGLLRASIFGVSDGLVSNLALVMGVVGATGNDEIIVLTGVAGLLAGAFSMGAGEWISMQSQRELFERQIELEREELRVMPEREEAELAGLYVRKGIPEPDARRLAGHLMRNPEMALDTKVREELGLDPSELGSPWGAAGGSFVAFTIGAAVPVIPFMVADGQVAFVAALVLSLVALFLVGAGVSLLTGRSAIYSGFRQMAIGGLAATVTFTVGSLIGLLAA
ncbi:MAG TPA: VIT1/CCC1 transporter family protein [Candidatus Limnocylindrales bacterium]